MTHHLYYQNVANNLGVLDLLVSNISAEETKEAAAQALSERQREKVPGAEEDRRSVDQQADRAWSALRARIEAYAQLLRSRVWRSLGRRARAYNAARRAVELARRRGERRLETESLGRRDVHR